MHSLLCFLFYILVQLAHSQSIGDRIFRTYTVYVSEPITADAAVSVGWNTTGYCDPDLGVAYNFNGLIPSTDAPLTLYFTKTGQISGAAVDVFGTLPDNLIQKGFWIPITNGQYRISVSFRDAADMCSGSTSSFPLGDRLIINAGSLKWNIPTLESDAVNQNWHKGSCFAGMGHHYFYDLATAPVMSWQAANLLPIVPMYANGQINAFFFASTSVQQGILNAHWWEPIPLPNLLMCKNTCDSDCTFAGTEFWSTFHIYTRDYTQVTCAGGCSTACCP